MSTYLDINLASTKSFFSSGLREKTNAIMDVLYAGGVNNPMDSIEQISYLLFLRLLTERDNQLAALSKKHNRIFAGDWAKYGWDNVVGLTGDQLYNAVRAAIENIHELPGLSATGKTLFNRATLKIYDRPTLRAVVQAIHKLDLASHDGIDIKGDMYEYLLEQISQSGTNGQFRTPRHIIQWVVSMVDPRPGERICDPACGTAGFLIAAFEHIKAQNTSQLWLSKGRLIGDRLKPQQWRFLEENAFHGFDNDANMVKIAILNLYLHQLDKADIALHNPLTTNRGGSAYPGTSYDVILANPPFSGRVQAESILSDLNHGLNTRSTETLFAKWFVDHLAPGGRAGIIVPEGVVLGNDQASRKIRMMLVEKHNLEAVISLPHWCFKPYASVATFILVFSNGSPTARTWMYQVSDDGFSRDGNRTPIPQDDTRDLLLQWSRRESPDYQPVRGKHGWVSKDDVVRTGYDLVPRRYLQPNSLNHDFASVALSKLCRLEKGKSSAKSAPPGPYPLVTTAEEPKTCNTYQFEGEAVCVPLVSSTGHGHASIKRLAYANGRFAAATIIAVLQPLDPKKLLPRYLYYFLEAHKDDLLVPLMKGTANVSLSLEKIGSVEIPVPSPEEQEQIIADLKEIDDRIEQVRTELEGYRVKRGEAFAAMKQEFGPAQGNGDGSPAENGPA